MHPQRGDTCDPTYSGKRAGERQSIHIFNFLFLHSDGVVGFTKVNVFPTQWMRDPCAKVAVYTESLVNVKETHVCFFLSPIRVLFFVGPFFFLSPIRATCSINLLTLEIKTLHPHQLDCASPVPLISSLDRYNRQLYVFQLDGGWSVLFF